MKEIILVQIAYKEPISPLQITGIRCVYLPEFTQITQSNTSFDDSQLGHFLFSQIKSPCETRDDAIS